MGERYGKSNRLESALVLFTILLNAFEHSSWLTNWYKHGKVQDTCLSLYESDFNNNIDLSITLKCNVWNVYRFIVKCPLEKIRPEYRLQF
jgi:hypothetical protein